MRSQQASWDSIEVEGVRTVYYYGGGKGWVNEKEFSADSQDFYYFMCDKLLGVLKEVIDWDWQVLYRTNSSSYINKERLKEFLTTLPNEKLYCGWSLETCVSGAGFATTKDCAKILVDNLDPTYCKEEDFAIGEILLKHGIEIIDDKSRYDYPQDLATKYFYDAYHIRFKTEDRLQDAENMRKVHNSIKWT